MSAYVDNGKGLTVAPATTDEKLLERLRLGLERASAVPLYYQLGRTLEQLIESGELRSGARLGSEIDLARDLGVSRPTVRRAFSHLAERGKILRLRGIGTVIIPIPIRRSIALTSVYDDLLQSGREPSTRVLALATVETPPEVAQSLGPLTSTRSLFLRRLRLVDDEPLVIMENYLPEGLLELDPEQLKRTGLYRLMRASGIVPRVAAQTIGARSPTPEETRLLKLERGTPILQLRRVTYGETGSAIEYACHAYNAALQSFELNLVNGTRAAEP